MSDNSSVIPRLEDLCLNAIATSDQAFAAIYLPCVILENVFQRTRNKGT
jgi:hypothetical protein